MAQESTFHPIRDLRPMRGARMVKFAEIRNPIPEDVSDGDDLKKIFDKYPWIPYARADRVTSQMLKWYCLNSGYMSETKGAVMNKVNDFSFGGQYQYINTSNPRLFNPRFSEEIKSVSDWEAYNEFVSGIDLCGDDYVSLAYKLNDSKQTVGEMGLEIIYTETAGIPFVAISCITPDKFMPVYVEDESYRAFAISPKFSTEYLLRYPAREVPVWPNYDSYPDGTIRTFLFKKDGRYKYVGRASDFGNFMTQYNQYKLNVLITKMIRKRFMPEVLIELEEGGWGSNLPANIGTEGNPFGNPREKSILRQIEDQFTADSDFPTSVMAITRKMGMKPFKAHEFKASNKENFYLKLFDRFEDSIIKANDLPKALMMDYTSGFNTSQFMDVFEIAGATKISKHQLSVGGIINEAINVAAEMLSLQDMMRFSLKFNSPIQELINKRIEANRGTDAVKEAGFDNIQAG